MNKDDVVREEILRAARNVFQKWGSHKSTMDDIAREAGKGKSTLYYYYQSKEDIFDAVVIAEFEAILDKARDLARKSTSAREKLIRYFVESISEMKNRIGTYTIVRDEIKRDKNFIKKLRVRFQGKEERYIEQILRQGIEKKEFEFIGKTGSGINHPDEDGNVHGYEVVKAAKTITGIMHALELYLLLENDDIEQVDIAARVIANGL